MSEIHETLFIGSPIPWMEKSKISAPSLKYYCSLQFFPEVAQNSLSFQCSEKSPSIPGCGHPVTLLEACDSSQHWAAEQHIKLYWFILSKLRLANGSSQTMAENSDITMLRAAAVCTTVRYIYEIKRTPPQLTIVFQWTSVSQLTPEFSSYNGSKRTFRISSTYFYDPDVLSSVSCPLTQPTVWTCTLQKFYAKSTQTLQLPQKLNEAEIKAKQSCSTNEIKHID